jgi:hypothetical protein
MKLMMLSHKCSEDEKELHEKIGKIISIVRSEISEKYLI